MSEKNKAKNTCPFWSQSEHICQIQEEGLFIPMEDHIRIYCTGSEYSLCRQYWIGKQRSEALTGEIQTKKSKERRQAPRVKTNHRLNFIRLSDSGHPVCRQPSFASTLDLSAGGMRLSTRELLMHESVIQFQFANPLSSAIHTGLARVKWCTATEEDLQYQAGLSFQSDQISEAVDQYLGSQA